MGVWAGGEGDSDASRFLESLLSVMWYHVIASGNHLMSRSQPRLQRLDERIAPSVANGDFYWCGGQQIALTERPNQIAVRFDQAQNTATLTRPGGLLAGYDLVQALDPTMAFVTPGASPRPRATETMPLDTRPDVVWSAPVFENAISHGWVVATNEIIVRLKPGVTEQSFFASDLRFSGHRRIAGTPDTFIATMSAGSGR